VPDGYVNLNGVAELCLSPCLTCSGIQLNCTLCISLPYFEGQCLPTCPSQYYPMSVNATVNETLVITTSICAKCVEPCLTCTSGSSCLSCTNNTYFYNYSCVGQCAQYYYSNATTWQC
jgi:proprotein convertase subtilisin/kexin type 5